MKTASNQRPLSSALAGLALGAALCIALWAEINPRPAYGFYSQQTAKSYAVIAGTVWGPDDRALQFVKVKIRRTDQKKAKWEMYTDRRGEFAQRVPAGSGDYVVWAEPEPKKGLPILISPELHIHIDNEERQDIGLHLKIKS